MSCIHEAKSVSGSSLITLPLAELFRLASGCNFLKRECTAILVFGISVRPANLPPDASARRACWQKSKVGVIVSSYRSVPVCTDHFFAGNSILRFFEQHQPALHEHAQQVIGTALLCCVQACIDPDKRAVYISHVAVKLFFRIRPSMPTHNSCSGLNDYI